MIVRSGPIPRWRKAVGLRAWRYWDVLGTGISGMVVEEAPGKFTAKAQDFHGWNPLTDSRTLEEAQMKVEHSRAGGRATTAHGKAGEAIDAARIIRRALETANGNVGAAAVAMSYRYPTRRTLDRAITALGLRPWHTETYSRSVRQTRPST